MSYMSFFKPRIIGSCDIEKMAELTPEVYQEVIRYKTEDKSYFRQPIDLSSFRANNQVSEAA